MHEPRNGDARSAVARTMTSVGAVKTFHRLALCSRVRALAMWLSREAGSQCGAAAHLRQIHGAGHDNACGRMPTLLSRGEVRVVAPQRVTTHDDSV